MVEIQLDLAKYIGKSYTFLCEYFENVTADLEEFFDELDLMQVCKSGGVVYKVGEMWPDESGQWKECKPGGVIQATNVPCPFNMTKMNLSDSDEPEPSRRKKKG